MDFDFYFTDITFKILKILLGEHRKNKIDRNHIFKICRQFIEKYTTYSNVVYYRSKVEYTICTYKY
jgi:hypothetical protein